MNDKREQIATIIREEYRDRGGFWAERGYRWERAADRILAALREGADAAPKCKCECSCTAAKAPGLTHLCESCGAGLHAAPREDALAVLRELVEAKAAMHEAAEGHSQQAYDAALGRLGRAWERARALTEAPDKARREAALRELTLLDDEPEAPRCQHGKLDGRCLICRAYPTTAPPAGQEVRKHEK